MVAKPYQQYFEFSRPDGTDPKYPVAFSTVPVVDYTADISGAAAQLREYVNKKD